MADTTKVLRVWATPWRLARLREAQDDAAGSTATTQVASGDFFPGDRPYLLLPIEDRALRVGDMLFRRGEYGEPMVWGADDEGWFEADAEDVWDLVDLLMDAVEGLEP